MLNKPLTALFGDNARLGIPIDLLDQAIQKYGPLRTYFSKYRNPVGIELEIENVNYEFREYMEREAIYWRYHEDGSLKVKGAEYVSVPISGQNIDYAIHEFSYASTGYDFQYTVRTSTHVHMNVSFMSWEELVSLVLLSAYAEPLLYTLCKPDRKGNPYCYPITQLSPSDVFEMSEELKYCGINTAPVRKQLTVEYRQLHGTNDFRLIRRWVQLLSKLYYHAKTVPGKEVRRSLRDVIKTRVHDGLIKKIFGASIVLFPSLAYANENLLWVLAALEYAENH